MWANRSAHTAVSVMSESTGRWAYRTYPAYRTHRANRTTRAGPIPTAGMSQLSGMRRYVRFAPFRSCRPFRRGRRMRRAGPGRYGRPLVSDLSDPARDIRNRTFQTPPSRYIVHLSNESGVPGSTVMRIRYRSLVVSCATISRTMPDTPLAEVV